MLRYVGLESIEGGLVAYYLCPLCPWGTERRKPSWRRKINLGAKTRSGKRRAEAAHEGWPRV